MGAKNGNVFLIEFSPIPASTRDERGWSDFHKLNFGEREEYESDLRRPRIRSIQQLLNENEPKYLIAYGIGRKLFEKL